MEGLLKTYNLPQYATGKHLAFPADSICNDAIIFNLLLSLPSKDFIN
ncbi:MAG: hypothetical protein J7604_06385 [Sporocytophaga sp.]|nr:hypothetical protein [Sporocytophaga sp.]